MLPNVIASEQYSVASVDLPLSFIFLKEWVLVRLQGKDAAQFLHNQFTCNIKKLSKHQYTFAAHCNPQGKLISNMYVFHFKDQEMAFIQKKSVCDKQIEAMKKYAVFSKITIIPDYNIQLVGIAGQNARQYLNMFFSILPDINHTTVRILNTNLLYFNKPKERFLLIINNKLMLDHLLNQSKSNIKINNNGYQWTTLDIEAGYPWIESATSEIFIPQAINLDILNGISFNKGCYIGQELITRIQYRGGNKKMLFRLINTTSNLKNKNNTLKSGQYLTLSIKNKNEKYIGTILQISQITEHISWIQVVFNKTILKYNQQKSTIKTIQTNNNNFMICS